MSKERISKDIMQKMIADRAKGKSTTSIGKRYKVSSCFVSNLCCLWEAVNKEDWEWVEKILNRAKSKQVIEFVEYESGKKIPFVDTPSSAMRPTTKRGAYKNVEMNGLNPILKKLCEMEKTIERMEEEIKGIVSSTNSISGETKKNTLVLEKIMVDNNKSNNTEEVYKKMLGYLIECKEG